MNRSIPTGIITLIRGEHVIVDADLAILYGVTTRGLNQAVKRNLRRFPRAYMFRLTRTEAIDWLRSRSQSVILKRGANLKYLPRAFTEHGALMAANVLKSSRAIAVSIRIVNAFVSRRKHALTHDVLARRLSDLEARYDGSSIRFSRRCAISLLRPILPTRGRSAFTVSTEPRVQDHNL
jgi:hypothetical protein